MLRRWYDRVVTSLTVTAVSVMLGAALAGTLSRYVPGLPAIAWGEEVTRFAGIWSVFLVAGLGIRRGAHLGVDILTRRCPPGARRLVRLVGLVLILAFAGLLLVYGLRLAAENLDQYSPALQWPMGLVYLCIPVGAALMIVEVLAILAALGRGAAPAAPGAGP
jgi:C4-dicarboxylate transporter DctQ subunit